MKKKATAGFESFNDLFATRLPVLVWVSLVYAGTVVLQFVHEPLLLQASAFTGLFTIHVLLHWNLYRLPPKRFWVYYSIQGALIYLCAILMPQGYQVVLTGLLPVIIAQCLGFSLRLRQIVFVALISIIIFIDAALTVNDTSEMVLFIPLFALMLTIVIAYGLMFFRQVHEKMRIQSFLHELEDAHQKVEELTLSNERQRMARDLHDTLAQGVAGLIMQLEAADAHMSKGNGERAQTIIKQSMQQARRTLAEARRAIDDLRLKSAPGISFKEAIEDEVRHFQEATGIDVSMNLKVNKQISRLVVEHSLYIVKECLTNVAKHSRANAVQIDLLDHNDSFVIEVSDNGKGFNPADIGKTGGHYGLLGIHERARLIGGEVAVTSTSNGTVIKMTIPMNESEHS